MTAQKTLRNCLDCKKALRPQGTTATDWPGTLGHHSRGLCSGDYKKRVQSGTLNDVPLIQGPRPKNEDAPDPITAERLAKLRRDQIDFHRQLRKRRGLDHTSPVNLRQIAMDLPARHP